MMQKMIKKNCSKICNGLLHKTKNTSLPTHSFKKDLADQIVSFFMDKIAKIRNEMSPSHPSSNAQTAENTGKLDSFHEVSEEQISKLILEGNSKSCCLDPLPTKHSETNSPISSSCHHFHCE